MRNKSIWLAFLILGLVLANNAWAQGLPTATLSGKVINEGQGLPGVSVTVKSPALQGTRSTVTSGNGDYTFVALPAGKYTVTYALSGFQPTTKQADLGASQSVVMNATLSLTAVAAEATVIGRTESISEATQASTTYTSDTMNKLPTARTIVAAVQLAPGVNNNGPNNSMIISGAESWNNLYLVNGANIADNVRATPLNLFVEDAIQETTITTGGVSAEYGRFAGGVVNAITKSGGNAFSGSFRTNFNNAAWSATPPKGSDGVQNLLETYEATLGGPIVKDMLWAFVSGRYAKTDAQITTQGTLIPVTQGTTDKRWEGKLTFTPFQNHTLTGSYLDSTVTTTNWYNANVGPVYDLASFTPRGRPDNFLVANYNGVLASNFFVEGQYSEKHSKWSPGGGSSATDLIGGTPIQDLANGPWWNSSYFCDACPGPPLTRDNQDGFVKATYFLSTPSLGSQNIVVGYDQFRGHVVSNNYQSGSQFTAYATDTHINGTTIYPQFASGASYFYYWPITQMAQPSNMQTDSAFLNDTWKINNKISLNLGVRYDKNHAVDSGGVTRQDDTAWSPRLGVTFDPKGDGKIRFNASYARYVSALQENFAGGASSAGSPSYYGYLYGGPDINTGSAPWLSTADALTKFFGWWGINRPDMFPTVNQDSATFAASAGVNQTIASGMKSPHTDEVALGIAGTAGSRLTYRVDGTYRKGGGFIETATTMQTGQIADPVSGQMTDMHVIQNGGSEYQRTYYGLAASFTWRPTDAVSLGGNWTWAHLYGNAVGESSGGGPASGSLNAYPEYRQLTWFAPTGELSVDQRHRVRLFGSYDFSIPKAFGNVSLGGIFQANSGTPYSAVGTINVSSYVKNPGYNTPPANNSYYFSSRGGFTTEAWYQLDLVLNYSYDIGPVQIFVSPKVLNFFNSQHISNSTNTNTTIYTGLQKSYLKKFNPFTTNPDALIQCPATATAAQCTAMGANWQEGPIFGQAANYAAYQQPRTFQLSVGLRF